MKHRFFEEVFFTVSVCFIRVYLWLTCSAWKNCETAYSKWSAVCAHHTGWKGSCHSFKHSSALAAAAGLRHGRAPFKLARCQKLQGRMSWAQGLTFKPSLAATLRCRPSKLKNISDFKSKAVATCSKSKVRVPSAGV